MSALADYLPAAIRAATGERLPVRAGRFPNSAEAAGPSVVWRQAGTDYLATTDGRALDRNLVAIECRSPTPSGAARIGDDILDRLAGDGRLVSILEDREAPARPSSLRAGYFARELVLSLVPFSCGD